MVGKDLRTFTRRMFERNETPAFSVSCVDTHVASVVDLVEELIRRSIHVVDVVAGHNHALSWVDSVTTHFGVEDRPHIPAEILLGHVEIQAGIRLVLRELCKSLDSQINLLSRLVAICVQDNELIFRDSKLLPCFVFFHREELPFVETVGNNAHQFRLNALPHQAIRLFD